MTIKQECSTKISRVSVARAWCAFVCAVGLPIASPVQARAESAHFNIASQSLPAALQAFAAQAHMQLLYEHTAVVGVTCNAVSGELDKRVALEQLLRGTGLEIFYGADNAVAIRLARANTEKNITKEQKENSIEKDAGPVPLDFSSAKDR